MSIWHRLNRIENQVKAATERYEGFRDATVQRVKAAEQRIETVENSIEELADTVPVQVHFAPRPAIRLPFSLGWIKAAIVAAIVIDLTIVATLLILVIKGVA